MKSKVKKLDGTGKEFEIEISKEKVNETFYAVLERIRKSASLPGFRPGNAPLDIIKKGYSKDAMDEVKQKLIPEAYESALKEHGVNPISYPELSEVNIEEDGNLVFKARVDAHPEVNIKGYKGLRVTKVKIVIEDKEVDEVIQRIRDMYAEFVDVDRTLAKNDFGVCDVETFLDGKAISKKYENMWIEVNKGTSLLGLGEQLTGLKKGDKKNVEAVLPEDYQDKKYRGKKVVFSIEVKEAKEKKIADLNDGLVKKLGKNNLDEVYSEVKAQLMEKKEESSKFSMKNEIIKQLLEMHSIILPKSMVARQLKILIEREENELKEKGVPSEAIEKEKGSLSSRFSTVAENKVKLYFVLDAIAARENIEVSSDEIDEWLKGLANSYNQSFEHIKKYYEDHNLIEGLKERLREEKTLDFLLSEAVISNEAITYGTK